MKRHLLLLALVTSLQGENLPHDYLQLRNAREAQITKINERYVEALKKLQSKYMDNGNFKVAVKIDEEIKSLTGTTNIDSGPQYARISKVAGGSSFRTLKTGVDAFENRPDRSWATIPDEFKGFSFSTYSVREPKRIEVDVKRSGLCYIAVQNKDPHPLKSLDWIKTDLKMTTSNGETFEVYQKNVEDDFELPAPSGNHGYIVIVEKT